MGDRRNVELVYNSLGNNPQPRIYLYTHWDGYDLPTIVADALNSPEGRGRWNDESYLARIIFSHMTKDADPETGYGIAPYVMDENHPHIVVDLAANTVDGMPFEDYIREYASKPATV